MKAAVKCLKGIIVTLQHLHQESGNLLSKTGGLLPTFRDRKSVILLFAVKNILDPVYKLALQLQPYNAALGDFPDLLKRVIGWLNEISSQKEYSACATNLILELIFPILDSTKHTDQEIHKSLVIPYIKALSENFKKRFTDKDAAMCSATSIFDPKKVKDNVRCGMR